MEDEECPVCDGTGEIDRERDEETIREEIDHGPLSIQVRSGWYAPGEKAEAEEYELLLSTGGPALRIIGDLDQGQPHGSPRLQWQDWGTPWTHYTLTIEEEEAVSAYVACFYFGE